ncbi:TPA: hypothetical protein N0F65_008931 [Lagenidium giganteum]|uniref:Uncharacterized protein n=1 Tax=Lagenidium giganteum TaxID=4803 RepID=A0AAV2YGV0_9STRA|nr:TPA: hypothetical protein N0F65_008931 [Lagenidium giganteum]
MLPEVRVPPHSAKAIGKSDPLETHVQVFTCSHVFPKRIFEEEVLPEFEKRMNALPIPLFSTKQVLLAEFKRAGGVDSAIEAPCPVCCFNKIGALVDAQYRASQPAPSSPVKKPRPQQPQLYFLHRDSGNHSNCSLQYQHSSDGTGNARRGHEPWEW